MRRIILRDRVLGLLKRELLLCVFSACLLTLAFPQQNVWLLAWGAFIPLMLALEQKTPRKAFWLGYLTGIFFFGLTLYWFVFVTTLGMVLLVMFLALYFACFAIAYRMLALRSILIKIFFIPAWWVALEFIRAHFLTGFGWVLLGHSQQTNLWMIQIADITGVYGISFLVMMVNVLLTEFIFVLRDKSRLPLKNFALAAGIVFFFIAAALSYGFYRLNEPLSPIAPPVRLTVLQANVINERRWDPDGWPSILKEHIELATLSVSENPDLIIWPESSFPGYYWQQPDLFGLLKESIKNIRTPSLVGLITREDEEYFNTAFLFSKDGEIQSHYHKITLVPFGEYIPLRRVFPFLSRIVPIDDFTRGMRYTLFPIQKQDSPKIFFGTLICFEDTLPHMAREFSRRGANVLVNITNDDWFRDTKAPFLHMQAALFRAVENRRPLVRSANTGMSCVIDSRGRIVSSVSDHTGKQAYVRGFLTQETQIINQNTFYTKFGDVFAYLCFGGILMEVVTRYIKKRKNKKV